MRGSFEVTIPSGKQYGNIKQTEHYESVEEMEDALERVKMSAAILHNYLDQYSDEIPEGEAEMGVFARYLFGNMQIRKRRKNSRTLCEYWDGSKWRGLNGTLRT